MDRMVQNEKKQSFSDQDLRLLTEDECKILSYDELYNYNTIEQVLDPHGCAIILYLSRPNYGHWTFIQMVPPESINGETGVMEIFDSYGYLPDDEIFILPQQANPQATREFKEATGQNIPRLTLMIQESPYIRRVIYNSLQLQSMPKSHQGAINTCGRWAGVRCVMRHIPLQRFQNLFINQRLDPDDYVTLMTMFVK